MRLVTAFALLALAAAAACGRTAATLPPPAGAPRPAAAADIPPAVDASTLDRKLMFGYQGWFGCPGDGSMLDRWEHWFRGGQPAARATLRVDMWPDVSELPPAERCPTPLAMSGGGAAELFSAYRPAAVDMHFRWLEEYELPGVFLQRFSARLDDPAVRDFRDAVARNVRAAAESHGRVFAVMYDISGHRRETLVEDVERDWTHLVDTLRLTESRQYLRHRGRPLLAIWGFGFNDRPAAASQAAALIAFFKTNPDPRYRATVLGGVPAGWRTLSRDAQPDPDWAAVYRSLDVISPWTVGRFRDEAGMDRFYTESVAGDLIETGQRGAGYMPVVFPGFSWHNMNPGTALNEIPRRGGRFFWDQIERAMGGGAATIYAAMFDEVDEGTAMFKLARSPRDAPLQPPTVTLDADGDTLPADWYLRLAREAQLWLRRRTTPPAGGSTNRGGSINQ
jgi:hypothetical protein